MKQIIILCFAIALTSFKNESSTSFKEDSFKKDYAKVKNDLYVSKYEVTNFDYRNFLSELEMDKHENLYNKYLPDTLVWRGEQVYNEPFVKYYFRSSAYNNYPVVGITFEDAQEYCKWLTNKYNQNSKRKFKTVQFRLLTKNEWIFAADSGDTAKVYTWGSGFMQNNRKQYLCNYKHTNLVYDSLSKKYIETPETKTNNLNQLATITTSVKSFYPSSFGMYNMCGNVAEMIEEKGIAKGGSFIDPAYKVRIASEKTYSKPQADIGFRVAMQIIEK